jgi:hypothetical protein
MAEEPPNHIGHSLVLAVVLTLLHQMLLLYQCQCPVCGPARTALRTGCTIERTGIQHNDLPVEFVLNPFYQQRVRELESLDHVLVEKMGYISE